MMPVQAGCRNRRNCRHERHYVVTPSGGHPDPPVGDDIEFVRAADHPSPRSSGLLRGRCGNVWPGPAVTPGGRAASALRLAWVPLVVFVVFRLVDAVFYVVAMRHQPALGADNFRGLFIYDPPMPASPGYLTTVTNWDGQWYQQIGMHGYPHSLPAATSGPAAQSAWAFYPLFPALVRLVMVLTPFAFPLAAAVVSTTAGAAATVVLHRMVLRTGGTWAALVAVVALCAWPASPVLQIAYTESLALLVLLICLWLLGRRRYGWLMVGAVLLGLVRAVSLPLALVIALHGLLRWRRRGSEEFPVPQRWWCAASATVACLAFAIWPVVAGLVTGQADAYTRTQTGWHGDTDTGAWPSWLSHLAPPDLRGVLGLVILAAVLALALVPSARRWGTEIRLWGPVYVLYLLVATRPIPSMARFLVLLVLPWVPAPVRPGRGVAVATIAITVVVGLVLQWLWVREYFVVDDRLGYP